MRADTTVLIIGAGPTGLTLACELARSGVDFRLLEASPGPQQGSRGKGLQPRTLEVFADIGVVAPILAHGQMGLPMRSIAPDGQATLTQMPALHDRPDIPYATTLIIPQWRIEEALRERLTELGAKVEFGSTLETFEQSDAGITAKVMQAGQPTTITARWLVGCDGGHSGVRKRAGITFSGETREEVRMIVADVGVVGLGREAWHMWRHEEGVAALCPLPSTDVFQYQAAISPGQNPELSLANMQATLERRSGRSDIHLQTPVWASLWRANIRLADSYRNNHVFLAGDAAHVHSPAGGQGMNTGIQDAHNLGWKLAAVSRGAKATLLDTYEAERRPIAQGVLALSNALLEQAMKNKSIATHRGTNTLQLHVGYRDSALARDDRDAAASVRAGDRAPDATLTTQNGSKRLFELVGGGMFTLLSFGKAPPIAVAPSTLRVLHVVPQPSRPNDLADSQGQLANAYTPTETTLVLLRPDGYIALVSDAGDAAAVSSYLTALL